MAKSKKQRILAALLCAGVMSGIYVSPALAAGSVDVGGYEQEEIDRAANTKVGVMMDGGWFAPDGKFYTYIDENGDELETPKSYDGELVKNGGGLTSVQREKLIDMGLDHLNPSYAVSGHADVLKFKQLIKSTTVTGAAKADSVVEALEDLHKFGVDYTDTAIQKEMADRMATDKYLFDQLQTVDTDTHLMKGEVGFDGNGKLSIAFVDKEGNPTGDYLTLKDVASENFVYRQVASEADERKAADANLQKQINTVDTDKHVAAGEYTVGEKIKDQIIMPIVEKKYQYDEEGNVTGYEYVESNESIVLKDVASAAELDVVQDKTQHITADENGTYIEGPLSVNGAINSSSVNTGEVNASNANIGNINTNNINAGNVNAGNVNANNANLGNVNAGNINTDNITAGNVNASNANIGNVNAGNVNTNNVNAGNVNTNNINAATGNFSQSVTVTDGQNGYTYVNTNDVQIVKPGENGYDIKLSDMGQVSDIDSELTQNSYYDNTVVGAVNAEADIRRSEVARLDNRIDNLDDRIGKVGAMSAAIANLHTMGYDPAAPTEIAVGVGQYRDDTGLALGMFHYPNRDFMLSLSVSTAGDEFMGGIGATWKLGRKNPEKVAAIKQAQAEADMRRAEADKLAKAEALKKAAREAKIAAQQARHAKMAAELAE